MPETTQQVEYGDLVRATHQDGSSDLARFWYESIAGRPVLVLRDQTGCSYPCFSEPWRVKLVAKKHDELDPMPEWAV